MGRQGCIEKRDRGLGSRETTNPQPKTLLNNSREGTAGVRWAFINGQGIRNKGEELSDVLLKLEIDLMGIAETWLMPGEGVNVKGYIGG